MALKTHIRVLLFPVKALSPAGNPIESLLPKRHDPVAVCRHSDAEASLLAFRPLWDLSLTQNTEHKTLTRLPNGSIIKGKLGLLVISRNERPLLRISAF